MSLPCGVCASCSRDSTTKMRCVFLCAFASLREKLFIDLMLLRFELYRESHFSH